MKIGIAGIGLMGKALALKLADAGFELNIYNRTSRRADEIASEKIKVIKSPDELIQNCDSIILILSDYNAICDFLSSINESLKNKTIIQMGTISSGESEILNERILVRGGDYFEAPVLGSIKQIEAKELITLVGSNEKQFTEYKNVFEWVSKNVVRIGKVGDAAAIKLALNQLIASQTAVFAMSLGYLRNKNISTELFMQILRESALYAPTFDKKLQNYLERDFENPNFPLKHLLKDVRLMKGEFERAEINTEVLKSLVSLIEDGVKNKLGEKDYSVIYNVIHPIK